MNNNPAREQVNAIHDLGEAFLRFLLTICSASTKVETQVLSRQPMPPTPPNEVATVQTLLVGIREAARLLSVSERTLWKLTAPRGPIPVVRLGKAVRYSVDDLREWLKKAKE